MSVSRQFSQSDSSFFNATLTGRRLILHPYSEARDLQNIASLLSNPVVTIPMGLPDPVFSINRIRYGKRDRANRTDAGDWSIYLPSDDIDKFIGETGIASWDNEIHIVEIFIALHPDHFGKAFGREAISLLTEHIWRNSPIASIRIQTLESNENALKLAGSLGFRESGRRYVSPDPITRFTGGTALILDCRMHEFKPFELKD